MTRALPILLLAGDSALAPKLRGRYSLRVLTRDAAEAERLRALGADVVDGDPGDPAALRAALEGCYAVIVRSATEVIAASQVEQVVLVH
jgi:uncharacterized protein YbjT (DUF2867 family)